MQKQKIIYLVLQSTYEQVEVALFQGHKQLDLIVVPKNIASGQLIPTLEQILTRNQRHLKELTFIGANLGPAPFTTLRTVISTLNGINFATQIPLVGVNGITTLAQECPNTKPVIAILNAFGDSLYYALKTEADLQFGWEMAKPFWEKMESKFIGQAILVVGEGINNLEKWGVYLPDNFEINSDGPNFSSINAIASNCLSAYQQGQTTTELQPLYLKSAIPASFQNRPDCA